MQTAQTVERKGHPAVDARAWIAIGILAAIGLTLLLIPRGSSGSTDVPQAKLLGTLLVHRQVAPQFRLKDQWGHTVSLSSLRGRPVVLTFMEAHCAQLCPRLADKIRQMAAEVDPSGRKVAILAMTTDPEGDTPSAARTFSRRHGLATRWHYLVGTRAQLRPLWHAYAIYAAPKASSPSLDAAHTSATYLIDRQGRERVLMGGDLNVAALEWDVRMLAGLATSPVRMAPAPEVGHPAPDFALRSTSGKTVHLHDLRGRVVLINFWATWCGPCRSEMPQLAAWYRSMHRKGFTVLGVDQQQGASAARSYANSLGVPYPVVLDSDGTVSSRYDVVGLPTSLLVDRAGIVRSVNIGVVHSGYLHRAVSPLLAARAGR